VLYRGKEVVPGAPEAVSRLKRAGKRVVFLTNNSTRTREAYVDMLRGMGIESVVDDIFTSASLTAGWLEAHVKANQVEPRDVIVYVIGEEGIKTALEHRGFAVAREQDFESDKALHGKIRFVIVGLDRQLTYRKLDIAFNCIANGAAFLATNDDAALPVEGGKLAPGAGAIVQALATCSKHLPDFGSPFGKPNPMAFHEIARKTRTSFEEMISVGDRPETDILASNRAGVTSILVLSGITRQGDEIPDTMAPDIILTSIDALNEVFAK
jgi:phosphoglycolate/pyridoxal phosphate phosphatase family enzyme